MGSNRRFEELDSEPWLPHDIMYLIMSKLMVFPMYLARFSAVCKSWQRLVCDLGPELVQKREIISLVGDWNEEDSVSYRMYKLTGESVPVPVNSLPGDSSTRIIGSSFGWLIIVSEGSVSLFNPLSKSHICMPPIDQGRHLVKGVLSKPPLLDGQHFDIAVTMSSSSNSKTITMIAFLHMELKIGELEESMQWVYREPVDGILDVNSIGGRICLLYINGMISCWMWSSYGFWHCDYDVRKEWHSLLLNGDRTVSAYLVESSSSEPLVVFCSRAIMLHNQFRIDYTRPRVEFKIFTLTLNNEGFSKSWNWTELDNAMKMREIVLDWTEIKTISNNVIFLSNNVDSICIQAASAASELPVAAGSIFFPKEFDRFGVFNVHQNCCTYFAHRPDDTKLLSWQPPIWLMPSYAEILKFSSIG